MALLATSNPDTIYFIVLPSIGMLFTFLGILVAGYPWWRQHQKKLQNADTQVARRKATEDAVLGTPADPNTGKPATRGLVLDVADLVKAVGQMNGTGKSLVEMAEEGLKVSSTTASLLNTHTNQDDQRFSHLEEVINAKK